MPLFPCLKRRGPIETSTLPVRISILAITFPCLKRRGPIETVALVRVYYPDRIISMSEKTWPN